MSDTKSTLPWHDDDDVWAWMGPGMFGPEKLAAAPDEVASLVKLMGLAPGAKVLDLACGVGRHTREFARRGFQVCGVDRTATFLQEAEKGEPNVEFVLADMREFCRPLAFDAVCNIFTAFGYFADPADDLRVLHNVHQSLVPGGTFVLELMGKEILARIFQPQQWYMRGTAVVCIERRIEQDWSWMSNRHLILDGSTRREFVMSNRIYSAEELKTVLQAAGFGDFTCYGSLRGTAYDHRADRLVIVARKPRTSQ